MEEINRPENIKHPLEKLGNFWVRFDDSNPTISNIYQKKPEYIKFKTEHPDLCAELHRKVKESRKISSTIGAAAALKSAEKELSDAFDIMKEYVEDENTLL